MVLDATLPDLLLRFNMKLVLRSLSLAFQHGT